MWSSEDSIFALSSGTVPSGVAIIRLSGEQAFNAARSLISSDLPKAREAKLVKLRKPDDATLLDEAIMICFPAPNSFTGENVVELHTHGSRAVISALSSVLRRLGLRPAEAGEFTKRAFLNDRMDLVEADGLADLIHADTEMQRRQALGQMCGYLTEIYEGWRKRLVKCLALIEAEIDFSDEELPENLFDQVEPVLREVRAEIRTHVQDGHRGERIREGLQIAVIGEPNVGKSSLINSLAKRDVAIVSEIAGTTRDILEVHLDLGGFPVTLADTAGLRVADDEVEKEGVRRAKERAKGADLKLLVVDTRAKNVFSPQEDMVDENTMVLWNKRDLVEANEETSLRDSCFEKVIGEWPISVKTGEGVSIWLSALERWIIENYRTNTEAFITRERYRVALEQAIESLDRALQIKDTEHILAAEDVRLSVRHLGTITGRVDVEGLLDIVFSEFCIGK